MSKVLMSMFDQCPNLMSELRVLEMFQGVSRREVVQVKSSCTVHNHCTIKIVNYVSVFLIRFLAWTKLAHVKLMYFLTAPTMFKISNLKMFLVPTSSIALNLLIHLFYYYSNIAQIL